MCRPSKRRATPKSTKVSAQRPILSRPSSSSTSTSRKFPKIPIQKGKSEYESESRPWSDLTILILERIRDLLDSTLDDLRLRSVCSNWRAVLALAHPRRSRLPDFPIKLPSLPETIQTPECSAGRPVMLKFCSLYHIWSADDPSGISCLFRALHTAPNTFTLCHSFHTKRMLCPPDAIPKTLDLLRVRGHEVCKGYWVDNVGRCDLHKVLMIPNFVKNVAFTVLVILCGGNMYYWNDGDSGWTAIGGGGPKFLDLILFNGTSYAVSDRGCLFSLDSGFGLQEVAPAPPLDQEDEDVKNDAYPYRSLMSFESDLFLASNGRQLKPQVQFFKWVRGHGWCRTSDLSHTMVSKDCLRWAFCEGFQRPLGKSFLLHNEPL